MSQLATRRRLDAILAHLGIHLETGSSFISAHGVSTRPESNYTASVKDLQKQFLHANADISKPAESRETAGAWTALEVERQRALLVQIPPSHILFSESFFIAATFFMFFAPVISHPLALLILAPSISLSTPTCFLWTDRVNSLTFALLTFLIFTLTFPAICFSPFLCRRKRHYDKLESEVIETQGLSRPHQLFFLLATISPCLLQVCKSIDETVSKHSASTWSWAIQRFHSSTTSILRQQ